MPNEFKSKKIAQAIQHANETNPSSSNNSKVQDSKKSKNIKY